MKMLPALSKKYKDPEKCSLSYLQSSSLKSFKNMDLSFADYGLRVEYNELAEQGSSICL